MSITFTITKPALLIIITAIFTVTSPSQTLDFTELDHGQVYSFSTFSAGTNWVDYDNDGDLDVYWAAGAKHGFFTNNGTDVFVKSEIGTITTYPKYAWTDLDMDDDMDLLIEDKIYTNDGSGNFTESTISSLDEFEVIATDLGDFDNDGDPDLACIIRYKNASGYFGKILYNNNGTFSKPLFDFPGGYYGSIRFMELNRDHLLDIIVHTSDTVYIYTNQGHSFTRDTAIDVSGYITNKIAPVDIDEDFDNDIITARRIIRNDYPEFHIETNFYNVYSSPTLEAGDVDNDGDTDFLYAYNNSDAEIYLKDGSGYTEYSLTLPILKYSNPDFGDYDQDGDLDFVAAYNDGGIMYLSIFRNDLNTSNTAPAAPSSLSETVNGSRVLLSWDHGSDAESADSNLCYNVHVNLSGSTYFSSDADFSTGFLKKNFNGNVGKDTSFVLEKMSAGSYTWSVQTIDPGTMTSTFASSGSFTISMENGITPTGDQSLQPGETGSTLTLSETGSFDSRYWAVAEAPGGPYSSLGSSAFSIDPQFDAPGDYYVVAVSKFGTDSIVSNEVHIACMYFEEIAETFSATDELRSLQMVDFDNDGDYDILVTADENNLHNILYEYDAGSFSANAGFSPHAVENTASACFDYDNDGWIDILLTGEEGDGSYSAILYKNNENMVFDSVAVFQGAGVIEGAICAGDYDNDGLKDVFIAGLTEEDEAVLKVFKNEGDGLFIERSLVLPPVANGTVRLVELNNDGYADLFLSGTDISGNPATFLYVNSRDGTFGRVNAGMADLRYSNADFADYNNDGYTDILLGGETPTGFYLYLYSSNAMLTYDESLLISKDNTHNIASWIDADNDGDLDILLSSDISKRQHQEIYSANLLLENTGSGDFEKNFGFQNQMNFRGSSSLQPVKYDADTDVDLMQVVHAPGSATAVMYALKNLSANVKTAPDAPGGLETVQIGGNVRFSWDPVVPADQSTPTYNLFIRSGSDLVVSGDVDTTNGFIKVNQQGPVKDTVWIIKGLGVGEYIWKVQAIDNSMNYSVFSEADTVSILDQFVEYTAGDFEDISDGGVAWGDYDNDGDLDILLAGETGSGTYAAMVYRNDEGVFNDLGLSLTGVYANAAMFVEWLDINNDNWLDIVLYGAMTSSSSPQGLYIYENNGDESFTNRYTNEDLNFSQEDGGFGDLDNDGDIDFAFSPYTILYNDGDFSFSEVTLNAIYGNHVDIVDLESDLDYDIVALSSASSRSMINNSSGSFNYIYDPLIPLQSRGETQWFDYNNDQYIDLLATGLSDLLYKSAILKNNQDGTFSEINTILKAGTYSNVCFGDYENDGDFDFFISGRNTLNFTEFYLNNNYTSFTPMNFDWPYVRYNGKSRMGDYDNDGDLDLLTTGENSTDGRLTLLFENTRNFLNTQPEAPSNLVADREGLDVILHWGSAADSESTDGGLSYNVRVGTTPGGSDIVSPMSDPVSGYRRIPKPGNAQFSRAYKLDDIPLGTYYWSVQAVDHGFMGGVWAEEDSFIISSVNVDFNFNEVCQGIPTGFVDQSVANGVTISHWDWDFGDGNTSELRHPQHQFDSYGTFDVKLVVSYLVEGVKTPGDSLTQAVTVKPVIETYFTASTACLGTPTVFDNTSVMNGLTATSWRWDFDDGETSPLAEPGTKGYLNAGDYTVKLKAVANNGCADSTDQVVQVAEVPDVAVTANAPLSFCLGDSVRLSVDYNAAYTYDWKLDGTSIIAGDTSSYTAKLSGTYTVEVTNPLGNCSDTSDDKIVSAQDAPASPTISASGGLTFCSGDSVILSVTDNPALTYQWKLNGGAVGTNASSHSAKTSGDYTVEVENSSGCSAASTNTVTVTVNAKPTIPTVNVSGATTFCYGESINLSVTNNPALTYQWKSGTITIDGATTSSYSAGTSGDYKLNITNADGCSVETDPVAVLVNPTPSAPTITAGSAVTFCSGDSVILSVTDDPSLTYQWKQNGGNVGTGQNSIIAKTTGEFTLEVSNTDGCSTPATNTVTVTMNQTPAVPAISVSGTRTFCDGGYVELSAENDPAFSYKWIEDGYQITGATDHVYQATTTGAYQLKVTNTDNCSSTSLTTDVTVLPVPEQPVISFTGETTLCEGETLPLDITVSPDITYK